jgi:Flp pilus assembly protein TadB
MTLFGTCYLGASIRPTPSALLTRPRFKIGITRRKVGARWREIGDSLPGNAAFPLFSAWGLMPEAIEATLHRLFRRYRRAYRGSGRTEWFSPPTLLALPFLLTVAIILLAWCILSLALALAAVGGVALTLIYFLT